MTVIIAIYEKGVLRPLTPLHLTEHQIIRLQIVPEETRTEADEVLDILVAAGLMRPRPETIPPAPMSDAERRELADQFGRLPGKPLSEIIIEDRGEE